MVDGPRAELPVELLSPELLEVGDDEGPEVQDIVARETVPLLHHHHLGTQQLSLDGRPQTTGARADDQDLGEGEAWGGRLIRGGRGSETGKQVY